MNTLWLKFAVQNTLRNRRRSLMTLVAMVLGLVAVLLNVIVGRIENRVLAWRPTASSW